MNEMLFKYIDIAEHYIMHGILIVSLLLVLLVTANRLFLSVLHNLKLGSAFKDFLLSTLSTNKDGN